MSPLDTGEIAAPRPGVAPGWTRISMEIRPHLAERVCAALEDGSALSVSLEDAGDSARLVAATEDSALWEMTRISALFATDTDVQHLLNTLRHQFAGDLSPDVRVESLADCDWVAVTREAVTPSVYGGRLWVGPTWVEPPRADCASVLLDPGLAFGTGAHPTTAACLDWLSRAEGLPAARVLDYGCGSGILGIAAAVLGAGSVWATDIDPQAVLVARANAELNGVTDRVRFVAPSALPTQGFEVVLANILLEPLLALRDEFGRLVTPAGRLILSGLLPQQAEICRQRYASEFEFAPLTIRDGWALLDARRRA